jgi:hypothetical protein
MRFNSIYWLEGLWHSLEMRSQVRFTNYFKLFILIAFIATGGILMLVYSYGGHFYFKYCFYFSFRRGQHSKDAFTQDKTVVDQLVKPRNDKTVDQMELLDLGTQRFE